ncbi:MAG: prephenate dehydratase [Candidatus Jacksonbacteria bacterium]
MKVFYLGPPTSFTHQAALKTFDSRKLVSSLSIEDVLDNVKISKSTSAGVVPVENSKQGIVIRTLDLILQNKLKVIAEINLTIQQCLLSKEKTLKNIKTIYSHPHALAQAYEWIKKHLPHAETKETNSTSKAAVLIQNLPHAAAIASKQAAKNYHLNILAENIHQNKNNTTRFWAITKQYPSIPISLPRRQAGNIQYLTPTKTSLYIIIKDKVGALRDLLDTFAQNHINLTSIQSRPLQNKPWQYGFFIDLFVDAEDPLARRMFAQLKKEHPKMVILGSYPQIGNNINFKNIINYNLKRINHIFSYNLRLQIIQKYVNQIRSPLILKNILIIRCAVAASIALYKYQRRQKIEDWKRERTLLRKMQSYDNLHALYLKIIKNSKKLQLEIISGLKSKIIKPNNIISFKIHELRYYIDYLDSMAINHVLISKSN